MVLLTLRNELIWKMININPVATQRAHTSAKPDCITAFRMNSLMFSTLHLHASKVVQRHMQKALEDNQLHGVNKVNTGYTGRFH